MKCLVVRCNRKGHIFAYFAGKALCYCPKHEGILKTFLKMREGASGWMSQWAKYKAGKYGRYGQNQK